MIKWLPFSAGGFVQACCYCGQPIPVTRSRYIASRDTNPSPYATIRHPTCKGEILYDRHGTRVTEDLCK
jgi:hypothetical protein